jgi:four helix bundle protein
MEYNLENRTFTLANDVRQFVKGIKITLINADDCKQMIRSSGSVGANYIEANEALSRKDFFYRVRVSRKEVKETKYWLNLIDIEPIEKDIKEVQRLIQECEELIKIFTKILKSDTDNGK